ncbi:MAG: ABC transporter ATP-binding protein [Steroidobacteraceae bacterium]
MIRPNPLWRVIRAELGRHRAGVLLSLVSLVGVLAMELAAPWPLKLIVDHLLLARPLPPQLYALQPLLDLGATTALALLAASIAIIAFVAGVFSYLQTYISSRIGHDIVHAVRCEVFAHLQRLTLAFHSRARSGELLTRVASDTTLIRDVLADWLMTAAGQLMLILGALIVMLGMNWRLASISLLALPILFYAVVRLGHPIRMSARAQRHQDGRLTSRLAESLGSMALIQAFGREEFEQARFDAESEQSRAAGVTSARVSAVVAKTVNLIAALTLAGTVFFGGLLALRGALSPGDVLIFAAYVTALFKPVRQIGKLWAKFARARVSADRLGALLATQPDIADTATARPAARLGGRIELDRVTFAYDNGRTVLDEASLTIAAGEHVAVIGPSGAGKSTLLKLILRLYEPQGGEIRIDGEPLAGYTRDSLREHIGVVLQDALFLGATVRENIAYGKLDASDTEIEAAARLAGVDRFLADLPEGFDSVVGERGCVLSGGQRQRISLARTVLRDPAILILDEPTSAIDTESAAAIEQAITTRRRGRTTIVIGHQFAAGHSFDRVIEVQDGAIRDLRPGEETLPERRLFAAQVAS